MYNYNVYHVTSLEGEFYYAIVGNTFVVSSSEISMMDYTKSFSERSSERIFPLLRVGQHTMESIFQTSFDISEIFVTGESIAKKEFLIKFSGKTINN